MRKIALALPILAIGSVSFPAAAGAAPGAVSGRSALTSTVAVASASSSSAAPAVRDGHTGPKGYTIVSNGVDGPADSLARGLTDCPSGTVILGGGVYVSSSSTDVSVISSFPVETNSWYVIVDNGSGSAVTLVVYAV